MLSESSKKIFFVSLVEDDELSRSLHVFFRSEFEGVDILAEPLSIYDEISLSVEDVGDQDHVVGLTIGKLQRLFAAFDVPGQHAQWGRRGALRKRRQLKKKKESKRSRRREKKDGGMEQTTRAGDKAKRRRRRRRQGRC